MKKLRICLWLILLLLVCEVEAQIVNVSTATQLQNALNAATPGQTIVMADGTYLKAGSFIIPPGSDGTSANPITLKGSPNAIVTCGNLAAGYGISLRGSDYWIFDGFTIYNSSKGIVADSSHHTIIKNLKVNKIGFEGIHLRCYSSYCLVANNFVDSTGLSSPGTAEGIYVGSAVSNWPTYTNGNPDTCNYNTFTSNTFGDHVLSENIDIKEGTKGGLVNFNTFNGAGLNNVNSGDSWIDVKGNDYLIECNTGMNTILDGFQTHIVVAGWGDNNKFSNNMLTVNQASGRGILVTTSSSNGPALNNVVCSNNSSVGAGLGLTNISAAVCSGMGSCALLLEESEEKKVKYNCDFNSYVAPNPFVEETYFFSTKEYRGTQFFVTDIVGKFFLSGLITNEKTKLSLEFLSSGIYILNINGPDKMEKIKIIKN